MPYQDKKQQQSPEENKKARPEEQFIPEQRSFGVPNSLMRAVPMTPPAGTPNSVMREMEPEDRVLSFNRRGFDPSVGAHELSHTVRRASVPGPVSLSVQSGTIQRDPDAMDDPDVYSGYEKSFTDAEQLANKCRNIILNPGIDGAIRYLKEGEGTSGQWHDLESVIPDAEIECINPILNYVRDCRKNKRNITPEGNKTLRENYARCKAIYEKCQEALQNTAGYVPMDDFQIVDSPNKSKSQAKQKPSRGNESYGDLGAAVNSYVAGSQYGNLPAPQPSRLRKFGNAISGMASSIAKHMPWHK